MAWPYTLTLASHGWRSASRPWLRTAGAVLTMLGASVLAGCAVFDSVTPPAADAAGTPRSGAGPALQLADVDAVALVNRVSWGVNASTLRVAQQMGLEAWLESQLRPQAVALPAAVQAAIDALRIQRQPLEELLREALAPAAAADATAATATATPGRAATTARQTPQQLVQQTASAITREAATRALLRAIHSPNQLHEQMSWFWMNHFSVYFGKASVRATVADYEENAIRPHALGRFRDLLGAAARHPAMLSYLDNDQNAARRINENFARELMELHTLGVDGGYTQQDVQELARILTGVGVVPLAAVARPQPVADARSVRDGLFYFNAARHDFGTKKFLGASIAGSGLAEFERALDLLAAHPATARFISRKLAMHFVADVPPPALVDAMAQRFLESGGDIAATLRVMFAAPAWQQALGGKFKDPLTWVVSAVRLAHDQQPVVNMTPLLFWINRLGEPLYGRRTPDGYPLQESAWSGSGQMSGRFEAARALAAGPPALLRDDASREAGRDGARESARESARDGARDSARGAPRMPRLQDVESVRLLEPRLSSATRLALSQASTPLEWNTFFLSSPEMMRR